MILASPSPSWSLHRSLFIWVPYQSSRYIFFTPELHIYHTYLFELPIQYPENCRWQNFFCNFLHYLMCVSSLRVYLKSKQSISSFRFIVPTLKILFIFLFFSIHSIWKRKDHSKWQFIQVWQIHRYSFQSSRCNRRC